MSHLAWQLVVWVFGIVLFLLGAGGAHAETRTVQRADATIAGGDRA